ncbi:MAG: hypothetical protein ACXWT0_00430 [Methylobacter sp.]
MFANLKNGVLTVNTYRFADATATTFDDLLLEYKNESEECLTASIENKLEIFNTATGWIATYTGLTGSEEISISEEAHNINYGSSKEDLINNANVWGADLDNTEVVIND